MIGAAGLGLVVWRVRRIAAARRDRSRQPGCARSAPATPIALAPPPKATDADPIAAPPPARPESLAGMDLSVLVDAPRKDERPWEATDPGFGLHEAMQQVEISLREMKSRRELLLALSRRGLDARQLSDQVVADPVLSAQILRAVNSAFYGLSQPTASVFRAVLYLGHTEVRNIIWRTCLTRSIGTIPPDTEPILQELWRHSFAASHIAYGVAKSFGLASPDAIATAALLHDVGKLIALAASPEDGCRIYSSLSFSRLEHLQEEVTAWGVCHTHLGAEMTRLWGLPGMVVEGIEHHHLPSHLTPKEVPGDPRALLAVHIADVLAHARMRRADAIVPYRPREAWLREFGLSRWEEVLTESVQRELRFVGAESATSPAEHAEAA